MRDQKGLTLVEVLVAVAIIAIVVTPFLGLVMKGHYFTTDARLRTEAALFAQEKMEYLLTLADPKSDADWQSQTGVPFKWKATVQEDAVTVGTRKLDIITLQVKYPTKQGEQVFEVKTYGKSNP